MINAARVSCQLSTIMAASTSIRLIKFDSTVERVEVKACCAPITSELSRDTELPGLGSGEERDGHLHHMVEDLGTEVEDQALADRRRKPPLHHVRAPPAAAARRCNRHAQDDHDAAVALQHTRCR